MLKFSDIIGQENIKDHMYNALRTGSISHAYIINGDEGSGRKTLAYTFAAAMQCTDLQEEPAQGGAAARASGVPEAGNDGAAANSGDAVAGNGGAGTAEAAKMRPAARALEPCGRCLSCIQSLSGNQPDTITITREKGKASIGIDEIRRMRADLQIKPYANAHKIYIVQDAEKLTVQAQNALLKTLEEPPEYAVIFLIANGLVNFLPTILSRCVTLQTRAVGEQEIAAFLREKKGLGESQAEILARFAGGNPGKALQLTDDQEFLELRDRTVDFLARIGNADILQISEFAGNVEPARRDDFVAFVLMWYRDVLVYLSTRETDHLIFQEDSQYIIEAARALGYEQLGAIIDQADRVTRRLKANVSAEAALESMLLNIRQEYRRRRLR